MAEEDVTPYAPLIGEIKLFAGSFPPENWKFCDGSLLGINENRSLFSIIATAFGGNGRDKFALPDLRGRVPLAPGTGDGLSEYRLGDRGGQEEVPLTKKNMPAHNHQAKASLNAVYFPPTGGASLSNPRDAHLSGSPGNPIYSNKSKNMQMAKDAVDVITANAGKNVPVPNRQPYLAINYIICIEGTYPKQA